jgi:hypothetical protein
MRWHSEGMKSLMAGLQAGDNLQSVTLIHNPEIQ